MTDWGGAGSTAADREEAKQQMEPGAYDKNQKEEQQIRQGNRIREALGECIG